jgi:CRP/FNR family transcriptional regulator, anaerobic regulatory protein
MDVETTLSERPRYAAAIADDVLRAGNRLRHAFLQKPMRFAPPDEPIVRLTDSEPPVILIHSGFAFRCCVLGDGRRAILNIGMPGDFIGLDHLVLHQAAEEIIGAANRVGYYALPPGELWDLMMRDQAINRKVVMLLAEMRWRSDRLAASIGRLDARARICVMVFDIYERLRRNGLNSGLTFNLPLTQEQIADHLGLTLVHVNRTLRRLREERIVLIERQTVIILDLDRLRERAEGLPHVAELPGSRDPAPRFLVPPGPG